jgi:disulfide oxidoreductase YuzD
MQLILNKYQTKLISSLIINNLHYNFIILNNKLIFTHKINTKDLTKLLNKHYYKYKLIK